MLGDKERDAVLTQTFSILCNHVISHNLYVANIVAQQVLAYNMSFRIERYAMVHIRKLLKELLNHSVVLASGSFEWDAELCDFDIREVVVHIVTKSDLSVYLLLTCNASVLYLFK